MQTHQSLYLHVCIQCAIDTAKRGVYLLNPIRNWFSCRLDRDHGKSQVCAACALFITMSSPICLFFALLLIAAVVVEVRSLESTISGEVESVRDEASSGGVIHRKKRYLDFIPLSRMFVNNENGLNRLIFILFYFYLFIVSRQYQGQCAKLDEFLGPSLWLQGELCH